MTEPRRGEVWWGEHEDSGRRPYLIMSRDSAIPLLTRILAVPLTRTTRGIPAELPLGPEDGLPSECVATFDNLRPIPKANFVKRVCTLDAVNMARACTALRAAVDC